MAIYDFLPRFRQIEPNNLKGLQAGFVVAQMEVDPAVVAEANGETKFIKKINDKAYFENGHLCMISADGIKPYAAAEDVIDDTTNAILEVGLTPTLFVHYTEPLLTVGNSVEFFAVDLENENPRLVQLIPGDEWMTDIAPTEDDYANAIAEGRIVNLTAANTQSKDDWYNVTTLPNGETGYHYMFLG